MPGPRPAAGWRRLGAGGVDYGVVAVYIGLLALVGALGRAAGLLPARIATPGGRILGQLAAIAVLTVPVTLWFAFWEAGPRGATQASACSACVSAAWMAASCPGPARCCARRPPYDRLAGSIVSDQLGR